VLFVYVHVLFLNCYSNILVRNTVSPLYILKYKKFNGLELDEKEAQSACERQKCFTE
jgi:hypothetical protein